MKKLSLAFAIVSLLAISCQKEEITTEFTQPENALQIEGAEEAAPDQVGETVTAYVEGQQVEGTIITINNERFLKIDGDQLYAEKEFSLTARKLVLEPGETPQAGKSVYRKSKRWPNNTVYYTVASDLPRKDRVTDAIAHWEQNTALRFIQRTNQNNYITFRRGSGCSSSVGMVGGRQYINLADGCSTGNNIHEIGHAVGFMHEQTRSDRDEYVNINFSNIQSGKEHNFNKVNPQFYDNDGTFDFGSIMMYSAYAFAKDRSIPTITKSDGSTFKTQRNGLSTGDKAAINKIYPAKTTNPTPTPTPTPSPTYENGQSYVIYGVRVYRYYNRWYYWNNNRSSSRYGWNKVKLVNQTWYYK